MLQSWDKLLSSSTSTEIHRDCGITVRSSGKWFCPVKQKCGPLPLGSAVNLNKLNLIEIELFIKMLCGVWSSLQPDHETNKSPRRMQVSPSSQEQWQVADLKHLKISDIFSLPRISTKEFSLCSWKGRLTDRLESTTALSILNEPKSFFVTSRLIAEVNEFFKNTGHTRLV